ncbi:hypothetical protein BD410DRAFT_182466 [Rickenella mellea]|uniref:Uncharacterized protein n=1 Tax=Rickenella mellea TaxID=50990 RepID=A0A4Y7Q6E8_9AGAM|nr:hypothetical protein BD410DRAFT_182466 [Rickenella mellea]
MIVSSSVNPHSKTDNHFVVLSYRERSVLVPTPGTYEEALNIAQKLFGLNRVAVNFETNDLDICSGRSVRINESAWEGIFPVLGNVVVCVEDKNYRAQFYNLVEHSGENLTVRGDAPELERRTNGITQKTNFVNGYAPIMASNAAVNPVGIKLEPPSGDSLSYAENTPGSLDDRMREMTLQTEARGAAPIRKRDALPDSSQSSGTPALLRTDTLYNPAVPNTQPTKGPKRVMKNANNGSAHLHIADESRDILPIDLSTVEGDPQDAKQYQINIEYPPRGLSLQFKVKARFSVFKVLKGACKAFNIKPEIAQAAQLKSVLNVNGKRRLMDCPHNETMLEIGVSEYATYVIEVMDHDIDT